MSRIVYAPFDVTVTTDPDQDIWVLTAGANDKLLLHEFVLWSASIVAEQLNFRLIRRTDAGSGGGAEVEVLADEADGSITAALTSIETTPGSAGAVLQEYIWEQLGPLVHLPTPEIRIKVQEAGKIALNLQTALGGSINMNGWVVWEEL